MAAPHGMSSDDRAKRSHDTSAFQKIYSILDDAFQRWDRRVADKEEYSPRARDLDVPELAYEVDFGVHATGKHVLRGWACLQAGHQPVQKIEIRFEKRFMYGTEIGCIYDFDVPRGDADLFFGYDRKFYYRLQEGSGFGRAVGNWRVFDVFGGYQVEDLGMGFILDPDIGLRGHYLACPQAVVYKLNH
jgi:hypothetical protein